jgi:hypothetical protein
LIIYLANMTAHKLLQSNTKSHNHLGQFYGNSGNCSVHLKDADICYDPTLITVPKTSHIQIISGTSISVPIILPPGKFSERLAYLHLAHHYRVVLAWGS